MLGMTARWWILLLILTLCAGAVFVYGEPQGYTLAIGRMNPTDQEQQEAQS